MEILEFALDGVFLAHRLLGELHVSGVEGVSELAIFAVVAVAANRD